ncbi:CoA transferase [Ramlibacter tataouinensis]|uniref:CaiB/BaiF CoA transferase family protein n=1 Tax=Ramlibacter tataouinensis TaxID=94132 RepID=UPI0022F38916|nr:CoA transferase [Ramlibacter tataouinensis]WBY01051.1 CoA transferase [Ramlibacter tataouinensis]
MTAGPLAGYRVLELGSTAAGPFCTRLLADFGAEVVKIEPAEGDPIRHLGEQYQGKSLYAASIARNKRIASIDLRRPEGRSVLLRMLPAFDAVVENFRPGTLERWGLSYEALCAVRPELILTRISGYGQDGPYAGRPGYGVIGEAVSGLREMIGDPDRPPARVAVPLTDYIAGVYSAFGTTMALLHRERTGQGQCIDTALTESAFSFMESYVPAYGKLGKMSTRTGPRLPNSAPNTLYPTRDAKHIHIAALADSVFRRLCGAMGQPGLAEDPHYATQSVRNAHEDALDEIITAWTRGKDLPELERILQQAEVPASRVFTMQDIFADPHYAARQMLQQVEDEDIGEVTLAGVVPRMSATPGSIRWPGHRIGQDTATVLRELAQAPETEIEALAQAGVIYCG